MEEQTQIEDPLENPRLDELVADYSMRRYMDAITKDYHDFLYRHFDSASSTTPMYQVFDYDEHWLSQPDSAGSVNILSLFRLEKRTFEEGEVSSKIRKSHLIAGGETFEPIACILHVGLRLDDNIRFHEISEGKFEQAKKLFASKLNKFKIDQGSLFKKADYETVSSLIGDCLKRMNKSSKIIMDNERKLVLRFYSLKTTPRTKVSQPPQSCPAPSLEELWIHFCRPEYYMWRFDDDFGEKDMLRLARTRITPAKFQKRLDQLKIQPIIRSRIIAMLEFMILWHSLDDDEEPQKWLRWELAQLERGYAIDENSARKAFEFSPVVQIMLNRSFNLGFIDFNENTIKKFDPKDYPEIGKQLNALVKPEKDPVTAYAFLMDYHRRMKLNFFVSEGLQPSSYFTATVSSPENGNAAVENSSSKQNIAAQIPGEKSAWMQLVLAEMNKTTCAYCGTSAARRLRFCGRCRSVAYCCPEHQKRDWKQIHKKQCIDESTGESF